MISRRLLRIKVLQAAYAYFKSGFETPARSEKELFFSIGKTWELYLSIYQLLIDLARYARKRIDLARSKMSPTWEDLNPNTRFADNALIRHLEDHRELGALLRQEKISWANHPELIRGLFNTLAESEFYREYLNEPEPTWQSDRKFVLTLLNDLVLPSPLLDQVLEEKSIYWNDDLEFAVRMAEKSLRKFADDANDPVPVFTLFKDEEDREFVRRLFRNLIVNHKDYEKLIEKHTRNWDVDRIAFMDILIMELAIAEILENESIPTRVSFNEYIEISKYYSTDKSSNFINGILDKIIGQLREENRIVKKGRGLIGEA